MNSDEDIAKLLGTLGEGPEPRLPGEARRERILGAMQQAARPARGPRWRLVGAAALVLATAAGFAFAGLRGRPVTPGAGVAHAVAGETLLVRAGVVSPLAQADATLTQGDRLSTMADSRATARLGGVALASLSPMTEISVEPEGCELRVGTAMFEVDPLPAGKRFLVRAPDVDVEVHGTAFRVTVTPGHPTRVVVSEGVVSVTPRSGEPGGRLSAGELWPTSAPSAPPPSLPATPLAADAPPPSASVASAPRTPPRAAPSSTPASELAEQNRLMIEAMTARRKGDSAAEKKALETYLRRYPNGPLAAQARSLLTRPAP